MFLFFNLMEFYTYRYNKSKHSAVEKEVQQI